MFQCSSASRKFLNPCRRTFVRLLQSVSVLFSEPKIPQSSAGRCVPLTLIVRFSALQRAENSSIQPETPPLPTGLLFQCSSASRKFLNTPVDVWRSTMRHQFQCSSASRKFLNLRTASTAYRSSKVSVLFSEPKIPQLYGYKDSERAAKSFSALQRAENSSMPVHAASGVLAPRRFSALQRAENSSMAPYTKGAFLSACFSALQRAENSSIRSDGVGNGRVSGFSALQRAEDSSMVTNLYRVLAAL